MNKRLEDQILTNISYSWWNNLIRSQLTSVTVITSLAFVIKLDLKLNVCSHCIRGAFSSLLEKIALKFICLFQWWILLYFSSPERWLCGVNKCNKHFIAVKEFNKNVTRVINWNLDWKNVGFKCGKNDLFVCVKRITNNDFRGTKLAVRYTVTLAKMLRRSAPLLSCSLHVSLLT